MSEPRRIRWFSTGAASAVAAKLDLIANPGGVVAFCDTGSEDEDNYRFLADVGTWLGVEIVRLKSDTYESTWDLWERRGYMSGINGAICTGELKFAPRLDFQLPSDVHIFGYTTDKLDVARAALLRETYPELTVETPLIDRGIDKDGAKALVEAAGIALPRSYAWGFPNANCLKSGCCKASSPSYWALYRRMNPEGFARTAAIARRLGVKLAIIGREKGEDGKTHNIRAFIDDLPDSQPVLEPAAPRCDFLCQLAAQDMEPRP